MNGFIRAKANNEVIQVWIFLRENAEKEGLYHDSLDLYGLFGKQLIFSCETEFFLFAENDAKRGHSTPLESFYNDFRKSQSSNAPVSIA